LDLATIDSLAIQVEASEVIVLGPEAALLTETFHFTAATKGGDEVEGRGVASLVVQLRSGRWQIIQCHESELNAEEETVTMPAATSLKRH
jgi:hypothetical protein